MIADIWTISLSKYGKQMHFVVTAIYICMLNENIKYEYKKGSTYRWHKWCIDLNRYNLTYYSENRHYLTILNKHLNILDHPVYYMYMFVQKLHKFLNHIKPFTSIYLIGVSKRHVKKKNRIKKWNELTISNKYIKHS